MAMGAKKERKKKKKIELHVGLFVLMLVKKKKSTLEIFIFNCRDYHSRKLKKSLFLVSISLFFSPPE